MPMFSPPNGFAIFATVVAINRAQSRAQRRKATKMNDDSETDLIVLGIPKVKSALDCGQTKVYELIGCGALDARKIGKKTVITAASLRAYLASLPKADIGRSGRKAA